MSASHMTVQEVILKRLEMFDAEMMSELGVDMYEWEVQQCYKILFEIAQKKAYYDDSSKYQG